MAKTLTKTSGSLTSGSVSAGSSANAVFDLSAKDGALITARITNGATGPTVQCNGIVLVAHKQASVPAGAAEGAGDSDWKYFASFSPGTGNNATARWSYAFGPEVYAVQVRFQDHTGQAITAEAHATDLVYS